MQKNFELRTSGREWWSRETISKILKNEKYTGNVMLQKTYVGDAFSGKQNRNVGQMDRYMIYKHHPAVVSREVFKAVNK